LPNIPKKPNQDVLDIIDRDILYFPVSGRLVWGNRRRGIQIGDEVGAITIRGYRRTFILYLGLGCHHIAWYKFYGEWPKFELDHKNEDKADNSILNLREVTHNQNRWNISQFRNNRLGVKGIAIRKGSYVFRMQTNGVKVSKSFTTLEQAIEVRDEHYKIRT
jgi:hypothetical protein